MNITAALALSVHLLDGDWNAVHPSIRMEHNGWSLGAVLNSEHRLSVVAGYRWAGERCWAELGAATGYSGAPVVPWNRVGCEIAPGVDLWGSVAATTKKDIGLVLGVEMKIGE